ncbi:ornithine decarboxylase [Escherichia coli]|uniref:Ornithine decarboxylase n=1 Tax=Escherichia coli TaxID=562 RepID=A0A376UDG8_ECOLX|nr:ornithine decarboxylase [Escherichia coli]
MSELKIAVSRSCPDCFSTHRACVNIDESNYIDVAAIIYQSVMLNVENSMK